MLGPDEPQDTSDPVDPQQVSADDELVQRVADGQPPPTGSPEGDTLAHWKATVEEGLPPRYSDPATAFLPAVAGDPRFNDPAHNPIAFLPVDSWGEDAHLVEPTWNGLRPDDEALPQPPQDPEWRPDGDR